MRLLSALVISLLFLSSCSEDEDFQPITMNDTESVIIHDKPEGIPSFYRTEIEKKKIEFFVIRLNGENRVFLNRCRRCFNSGLGFRFEEGLIRCKACNVTYPVREISKGIGSCYPIPVKARSEGRRLYISSRDLLEALQ